MFLSVLVLYYLFLKSFLLFFGQQEVTTLSPGVQTSGLCSKLATDSAKNPPTSQIFHRPSKKITLVKYRDVVTLKLLEKRFVQRVSQC